MKQIILDLYDILNMIKGFAACYSTKSIHKGKILVTYNGTRYVLELREIKNPAEDIFDDVNNLEYL